MYSLGQRPASLQVAARCLGSAQWPLFLDSRERYCLMHTTFIILVGSTYQFYMFQSLGMDAGLVLLAATKSKYAHRYCNMSYLDDILSDFIVDRSVHVCSLLPLFFLIRFQFT